MNTSQNRVFLALLGLLAFSTSGCVALLAGGAAGAAGYAYAKGATTKVYPVPVDAADRGVQNAIANLEVAVRRHDRDATGSRTEAQTAHGKKFTVETKSLGPATEIKVRVGTFGDDEWTDLIFAQLDQQLGSNPPAQETIMPAAAVVENEASAQAVPAVSSPGQ